jgi:hypothetical protein
VEVFCFAERLLRTLALAGVQVGFDNSLICFAAG